MYVRVGPRHKILLQVPSSITIMTMSSSTMQNVIGPIRISHLYRTFLFFIFSWPYYVLPTPKSKPEQINNKSQTIMLTAATQESLIFIVIN